METASKYQSGDYFYEDPYIHTRSGRFYLKAPRFDVDDIAHSLGMLCRFNGHTARFYSVAEHCCLVAYLMAKYVGGDPFEGLLHDAGEAYLSDIPTPFKRLLPDWSKFDAPLETALRAWAKLPPTITQECKLADKLALHIEANYLVPEGGADFIDTGNVRPYAMDLATNNIKRLPCWSPEQAARMWRWTYDGFTTQR